MKPDLPLIQKLNNIVIEHPNFLHVKDSTLAHVQYGPSNKILFTLGSTGVGKSTVIRVCNHILTNYVANNPELEFGPPLVLEAFAPETGDFDWRAFYAQALDIMNEPGIKSKVDIERAILALKEGHFSPRYSRLSAASMRGLYLENLNARRPITVFIDEVQNLANCRNKTDVTKNLNVLKGLANRRNTTYVASGTLEAQDMLYHNGQLARRLDLLHFKRYPDNGTDYSIFCSIIENIFKALPIEINADVNREYFYFFCHTLGCVGIFVDWIIKTLKMAAQRGISKLDKSIFESARLKNTQLKAIAREISRFERTHQDEGDFNPDLFFKMESEMVSIERGPTKKSNRTPGVRKPTRDLVGV